MAWRKAYDRWSVEDLEKIRDEVREAYEFAMKRRQGDGFQSIANKYNLEQGLLMILATDLWDTFKDKYRENTDSGLYLKWQEYRDVHS
jgi:hypothetical protein